MIELKPCPFCNGTAQMIDTVDVTAEAEKLYKELEGAL